MSFKSFLNAIKNSTSLIIIFIFNCLPIKNNKIFLFSYYGSQYGCNPKYISEHILKRYPKDKFDLVWAFNDLSNKGNIAGVRTVKTMSIKYFYELCTSKIVITNFRTTNLFRKRKNQFYIQTWHSSLRLKQIEKDAEDLLPLDYVEMAKQDSRKIDLLLSGCKVSTEILKRSFWYNGEIFEQGTPRNDLLFQQSKDLRKNLLNKLNIPDDYRVVLYAPTFRKNNQFEVYNLDYPKILEKLSDKFGGRWIFLVKLHPHMLSQDRQFMGNNQMVKDVTKYDDIQELLSIADVLISDYSSLIFDYSITKRPCFLYVPDLFEYTHQDRPLYFNLTDLPFTTATNNPMLLEKIDYFNTNEYNKTMADFLTKTGSFEEGKACEALTKRIEQVCLSNEKGRITYEAI
ncbi:CDP-glycerol glycerophosphotransferase family protein [Neobacillus massiliamazoniensis]|uniref:CDP-glycerol:poly(Glycerophosphate) glycerophosphotransferase n=1 Tax=Neobacillus massiliamazoniensis TaxID=1499688 RepID=A0A0U1NUF1_9BACI|nr:CDP-glycerol glycerophosphotransferase family protein [Neobacillus massiliamazoniensis]CRK81681.1 CDP-glycerol:poly(glycerophosphate) glycerophosphotransferase [Neobacillus massiliamazoniensis]